MSDSGHWIDPALDGSGGGLGKVRGMTVRELSQLFSQIVQEGNMRSVTAILRICREQLEARSQVTMMGYCALLVGLITLFLGVAIFFAPETATKVIYRGIAVTGVLFAGFLSGALVTRKATVAAMAQERAIRELAVDALQRVVDHPHFKAKPLDAVQKQTLRQILAKVEGSHSQLGELLSLQ